MRSAVIAAALWLLGGAVCLAQPGPELVADGMRLLEQRQYEAARQCFDQAVERGRVEGDGRLEAGGHYGLGKIGLRKADYAAARESLERALPLFRAVADRLSIGNVLMDLGYVAWAAGPRDEAVPMYREALGHFEASANRGRQASALYNLAFTLTPGDEQLAVLLQGLELTRQLGDRRLEGLFLHRWADQDFVDGDLAQAAVKLEQAAGLLRETAARPELARVLTSMGRLHRSHGQPGKAIELYREALAIQRELNDRRGVLQSIDAMATAYQAKGDQPSARASYEQALALALEMNVPALIGRQRAHLASVYLRTREFARAVTLLEESVAESPKVANTYQLLAEGYLGLDRDEDALAAANHAVSASASTQVDPDEHAMALHLRARILDHLGRETEALADARESVRAVEQLRPRLVADDTMRREFMAQRQGRHDLLIELLYRRREFGQALEVAEQGRARAFLDLLATRSLRLPPSADARLRSVVAAPAFSLKEMAAAADRLHSTLLSYWVAREATYVWVVSPGRPVHAARVEVTPQRLEQLVASPAPASKGRMLRTRGGDHVVVAPPDRASWRRLYDLLVRPVGQWLPPGTGERLTVVPHGPLLRLSFAALRDERGRYLLERYALHYVPAAAVLDFTARTKERIAGAPASYLLVADPGGLPRMADGRTLPRLPGTRAEVDAIARQVPKGSVTLLTGERASEAALRAQVSGKTVIHLATHGIVSDDEPFESFLALGGQGRLTAGKIYGLDLAADLVVLSACRTGLGRVSGDGIVGLTRAFFYAGTPSVVATLWDVADEPTHRLVSAFYRGLARRDDKAGALRAAQLELLRSLRRGQVTVNTPLGPVNLPESPVFWAGFVLQGEI